MTKPPLQFTRPSRAQEGSERSQLRPAPSPEVDLESPQVHAFSLRGRISVPLSQADRLNEPTNPSITLANEAQPALLEYSASDDPWRYVAVKLPAVSGWKLSEIADLRCSKRTRVVLELLDRSLRELAANHRTGACPTLPRVSVGTARSGISLVLPKDLAEELRYIVETRGAVKAQILSRLLVPAIDALYIKEVLSRR
jgi:hypothetical protein